jgi:cytochrome b
MSASRAKAADSAGEHQEKVLVWDAPVRIFHWLLVLCFAGAWLSAESERWRLLHNTLGYTMIGLVCFRVLWGLVGSRYARFSNFVRGPAAIGKYLGSLQRRQPEHHLGHNPAGAVAIVALLTLILVVGATGWASLNELGGEWLGEGHELAANLLLAVVLVHLAGVLVSSWMHRENLVGAMFSGRKAGRPADAARSAWWVVATSILLAVGAFWWWQWQSAPTPSGSAIGAPAGPSMQQRHDD